MTDLIERVSRILFAHFGTIVRPWEELPVAAKEEFRFAARIILKEFAAFAPVEAESLVEKIRETRQTRLGFLYMAYALNRNEAAALLAFRAMESEGAS